MNLLAVVIPARDEEATIGELLDRVSRVEVPGCELRAIVVDDGSTDRTARIARERGAILVTHPRNLGLGAAVEVGAEVVAYLDADLEYFPEDVPRLVEPIVVDRADYVLGNRFSGGAFGGARGMRLHRRAGNAVFTTLLSVLAWRRVADGQTGMRAFSRKAAARAEIVHDYNYAQVLTLDLLRKGFRMEEIPIRYQTRKSGMSFISWRYPVKVLPAIWKEMRSP